MSQMVAKALELQDIWQYVLRHRGLAPGSEDRNLPFRPAAHVPSSGPGGSTAGVSERTRFFQMPLAAISVQLDESLATTLLLSALLRKTATYTGNTRRNTQCSIMLNTLNF